MFEEAGKIISSAFNNSFIKRLCLYLHDCVREEVQSEAFRNLKQDKDNKWVFLEVQKKEKKSSDEAEASVLDSERLFSCYPEPLKLDGSDPFLNELMIQGKSGQKDKYLIYGYLFLTGKNTKVKRKNEFLTPLFYSACTLERSGLNIECRLSEEGLSLNTAAVTSLMNVQGEEDEIENMLDGLLDAVPKLPLKEEDLNIFLAALKALVPDLEIDLTSDSLLENRVDNVKDYRETPKINFENMNDAAAEVLEEAETQKKQSAAKPEKAVLVNKSAVILVKRPPVTAGVLYELSQIAEMPSGTIRETALNAVQEEYLQSLGKAPVKAVKDVQVSDFAPVTPLALSTAQENVIKNLADSTILSVYGPPGTGKSQTIVNLVCHLTAEGKSVLIASRMDKAADVIADRLNSLGIPYMALRAGRADYQRQLSNDLQDLLSGKSDIDTGFEDSLLADTSDMKKLFERINAIEKKCSGIIKLEENWQKASEEYERTLKISGKPEILDENFGFNEIEAIDAAVKNIEKYSSKKGIISKILTFWAGFKLKKIINKRGFNPDAAGIEKIRFELETARLEALVRDIENKINSNTDINTLASEIKTLHRKQKTLAIDILKGKRRAVIKELLRDPAKRRRLIVHTKALAARKQNLQYRLLEEEDFRPLLEAFPCWCTTSYAVSNSIPLKPAMFDVCIIDEASQCDTAGCLPILFRSAKAVIVGDDKQLPHLSFLEKSKEQSFLSQYEIPDKYQLMWRFRTNSMFDAANYYSMKPVLLDEHFRSAAPIIDFSIQKFYGGKVKVMSNYDDGKILELIRVPDGKADSDMTRNTREVEALMQRLQELINEDKERTEKGGKPVSIGIVSPFRGQVELIKKALAQLYPDGVLRAHRIEAGTAHTFQGGERDIMMLSWAIADNSFSQSLTFLQLPNLFNVAVTRAKKKQIVFLSKDPKTLPSGLLKDYIEFVQAYIERAEYVKQGGIEENIYKNDFEHEFAEALRKEGFTVSAGLELAGVSTDLTVKDKLGRSVIIECCGMPDEVKSNIPPVQKLALLERAGIQTEIISYREWILSSRGCIDRVKSLFPAVFADTAKKY